MNITNIAVHHAGGIGTNQYASSRNATPETISAAHKDRWNFPSRYMKNKDGKPWYGGYNCIYDPKDRSFTQYRAIGEETAAQYGFNFNTFSLCIIGNYMKRPIGSPKGSVDPLTDQIKHDVTLFLHDLIEGNKRRLRVAPGTTIDLSITRVRPHRFYQPTECYGDFIDDTLFRDLLIAWKPAPVPPPNVVVRPPEPTLEERNAMRQLLMQLVAKLQDLILKMQKRKVGRLGAVDSRSCEGIIRLPF